MTTARLRLNKLYPALSLGERYDATLARFAAGEPFDDLLAETVPEHDADKWNEFVDLLLTTHTQMSWYIDFVEAKVTQTELRVVILTVSQMCMPGTWATTMRAFSRWRSEKQN